MSTFNVDESNVKRSSKLNENSHSNNNNESATDQSENKVITLFKECINSRQVKIIINPFSDSSEGCQLCYKICAGLTCFLVILILYLMLTYQ
jgi:hypothetical protein